MYHGTHQCGGTDTAQLTPPSIGLSRLLASIAPWVAPADNGVNFINEEISRQNR